MSRDGNLRVKDMLLVGNMHDLYEYMEAETGNGMIGHKPSLDYYDKLTPGRKRSRARALSILEQDPIDFTPGKPDLESEE